MKDGAGTESGGPGVRTSAADRPAGRAQPGTSARSPVPWGCRESGDPRCGRGAAGPSDRPVPGKAPRGSSQTFVCASEQQPSNLLLLLLVTTLCSSLTFVLSREGERAASVIAERTRRRLFPGRGPFHRGSQCGEAGRCCCPARRRGPARSSPRQRVVSRGSVGATGFRAVLGSCRYTGERHRPLAVRQLEALPPVSVPVAAPSTNSAPVRRAAVGWCSPHSPSTARAASGFPGGDASSSATGGRGRSGLRGSARRGAQLRAEKNRTK